MSDMTHDSIIQLVGRIADLNRFFRLQQDRKGITQIHVTITTEDEQVSIPINSDDAINKYINKQAKAQYQEYINALKQIE
jgi:hypothetical protein